jgi:TolB-like protein
VNPKNFFGELKRRNVYKVAIAYAVVAWLLIQLASILFPTFDAPSWVMKVFVAMIALGFPVALILAWAFELTPEGIKRVEDVDLARHPSRGRAWIYIAMVSAVVSIGLFLAGRYTAQRTSAVQSGRPSGPSLPEKSIAVLPFNNLSRDPDNAYFADGVQDEILTDLARIADLKVISRTSVMHYKSGIARNLHEIGEQLGVAHVLEGSVQRAGNRVRVNAQLVDARTDRHLWG